MVTNQVALGLLEEDIIFDLVHDKGPIVSDSLTNITSRISHNPSQNPKDLDEVNLFGFEVITREPTPELPIDTSSGAPTP